MGSTFPAVLIPAYGRIEVTRRTLAALREEGVLSPILVDDCGTAGGPELAAEFPGLDVLTTDRPVWWTGGIVLGLERALARGDGAFLFFNQDVSVTPGYFERLRETSRRFPKTLLGSTVLYAGEPGRVWSAGGKVEWFGRGIRVCHFGAAVEELPEEPFEVDWLFGMGTLVTKELLERIGPPDASRFPMAWSDTDFSLRARGLGVPLAVDPKARLLHEVGSYDARVAGPPSARRYVLDMRDPHHNLSISSHAEIWRRHGPRGVWPLSLALRVLVLLANYIRIRILHPGEGRDP